MRLCRDGAESGLQSISPRGSRHRRRLGPACWATPAAQQCAGAGTRAGPARLRHGPAGACVLVPGRAGAAAPRGRPLGADQQRQDAPRPERSPGRGDGGLLRAAAPAGLGGSGAAKRRLNSLQSGDGPGANGAAGRSAHGVHRGDGERVAAAGRGRGRRDPAHGRPQPRLGVHEGTFRRPCQGTPRHRRPRRAAAAPGAGSPGRRPPRGAVVRAPPRAPARGLAGAGSARRRGARRLPRRVFAARGARPAPRRGGGRRPPLLRGAHALLPGLLRGAFVS